MLNFLIHWIILIEAAVQETKTIVRKTAYLDALKERVLVFDGAMGTMLQSMKLTDADFGGKALVGCNDALVLS